MKFTALIALCGAIQATRVQTQINSAIDKQMKLIDVLDMNYADNMKVLKQVGPPDEDDLAEEESDDDDDTELAQADEKFAATTSAILASEGAKLVYEAAAMSALTAGVGALQNTSWKGFGKSSKNNKKKENAIKKAEAE